MLLPMHKFLRHLYIEKTALWGVLGVLNAPLAFVPGAMTALFRLHSMTRNHDIMAEEAAQEGRSRPLPPDDPLFRIVRDMGKVAGVSIQNVFIRNGQRFQNAEIVGESRHKTSLIFQGNPLRDAALNRTPQGDAVMRGVIAHEIGHALSSSDNTFHANAFMTGLCYSLGSGVATIAGFITLAGGGLVAGAGLLGGAVLSAGAGFLTMALNQRFSRNEEFLADLRGAEIFGADNMIICHEYNLKILVAHPDRQKSTPQTDTKPTTLGERFIVACLDFYGGDHPAPAERIAALRSVFQSSASYIVPTDITQKKPAPPTGPMPCTHS